MSIDLYLFKSDPPLFGRRGSIEDPVFIIGVPFDAGATETPGQRFAPRRIREVSLKLETFSPSLGTEVESLSFFDAGDTPFVTEYSVMQRMVSEITAETHKAGKTLVVLGGDHSVTAPVVLELARTERRLLIIIVDAHLDLRDKYPFNLSFTHATVMRRIIESSSNVSVAYYKPRAFSREEYAFLKSSGRARIIGSFAEVRDMFRDSDAVYISLDIDGIDPAYAPGTGTPEPIGLHPGEVVKLISLVGSEAEKVVGLDIVEVNPLVDCNNVTSLLAAKLLMHFLLELNKEKKEK